MILVSEIWDEAKRLVGVGKDEVVYQRINRAIEILSNKSDWDPLVGFIDISADEDYVSLPREIETPIAVSYGRFPAIPRDQLYRFHLNGPGDGDASANGRFWEDCPDSVLFRDLDAPAAVAGVARDAADVGKTVWVYGWDIDQARVRTLVGGVMQDGYPVVLQAAGPFVPDPAAPSFSRIDRVRKPETVKSVELWSVTLSALDTLLAIYDWFDTEPSFRRLRLDRISDLVRIHFRRRNFAVRAQTDLIPLHSAEAVEMMIRSLKYYKECDFAKATSCEVTAMRWLQEEQSSRNPSITTPIEVGGVTACDDWIT